MLDTDGSNVGAALSQVHQGHERVIAYYSQALNKPERNYCTTRHECLAIVKAIDHFHPCLSGRKFTITPNDCVVNVTQTQVSEGPQSQSASLVNSYHHYSCEPTIWKIKLFVTSWDGRRLENAQSEQESPILTPPQRLTGPNGIRWLLRRECCIIGGS